jgi:hypothetical protein
LALRNRQNNAITSKYHIHYHLNPLAKLESSTLLFHHFYHRPQVPERAIFSQGATYNGSHLAVAASGPWNRRVIAVSAGRCRWFAPLSAAFCRLIQPLLATGHHCWTPPFSAVPVAHCRWMPPLSLTFKNNSCCHFEPHWVRNHQMVLALSQNVILNGTKFYQHSPILTISLKRSITTLRIFISDHRLRRIFEIGHGTLPNILHICTKCVQSKQFIYFLHNYVISDTITNPYDSFYANRHDIYDVIAISDITFYHFKSQKFPMLCCNNDTKQLFWLIHICSNIWHDCELSISQFCKLVTYATPLTNYNSIPHVVHYKLPCFLTCYYRKHVRNYYCRLNLSARCSSALPKVINYSLHLVTTIINQPLIHSVILISRCVEPYFPAHSAQRPQHFDDSYPAAASVSLGRRNAIRPYRYGALRISSRLTRRLSFDHGRSRLGSHQSSPVRPNNAVSSIRRRTASTKQRIASLDSTSSCRLCTSVRLTLISLTLILVRYSYPSSHLLWPPCPEYVIRHLQCPVHDCPRSSSISRQLVLLLCPYTELVLRWDPP